MIIVSKTWIERIIVDLKKELPSLEFNAIKVESWELLYGRYLKITLVLERWENEREDRVHTNRENS